MMLRRTMRDLATVALVTLALLALVTSALAQSGGDYELTWSTVDGGGYMFSTGGVYSLGGTVGQPDTGQLTGGDYNLGGGFWAGGAEVVDADFSVYLPLVMRNAP